MDNIAVIYKHAVQIGPEEYMMNNQTKVFSKQASIQEILDAFKIRDIGLLQFSDVEIISKD